MCVLCLIVVPVERVNKCFGGGRGLFTVVAISGKCVEADDPVTSLHCTALQVC